MEQLHDRDDDAGFLHVKDCVGEAAARSYLAWLASADLYDPKDVLTDPGIVAWHGERPDSCSRCSGPSPRLPSPAATAPRAQWWVRIAPQPS